MMLGADTLDIGSHGLIGDMSSAALVGTDGLIDWCCLPRFDSPSVFAALLDSKSGGRFQISSDDAASTRQAYLPDTNVLQTSFSTATGTMTVTDFMPVRRDALSEDAPHEVHRMVSCDSGEVAVKCVFEPRLDYARGVTTLRPLREGVQARGGRQALNLLASVPMRIDSDRATARFPRPDGWMERQETRHSASVMMTTALSTPRPRKRSGSPSRSSTASFAPVDAQEGTSALPHAPSLRPMLTSTVGLPRESSTSRARMSDIVVNS